MSASTIAPDSLVNRFQIARRAEVKPPPTRPSTKYVDDVRVRPHARATNPVAALAQRDEEAKELPSNALQQRVSGHVSISPISLDLDDGLGTTSHRARGLYSLAKGRGHSARVRLMTAMAIAVFGFGMFVSVQGWLLNRQVGQSLPVVNAESADAQVAVPEETKPDDNTLAQYQVAPDMPRYLSIESQGVKSRVLRMGLTGAGAVDTPNNVHDTGWYEGSAKPGEGGVSLIVGHVSGISSPGVFGKLSQLRSGDVVSIERGDGKVLKYRVTGSESFAADNVDMAKVLSHTTDGKEALNLVTCHGSYNAASHEYNERIVVYTTRI